MQIQVIQMVGQDRRYKHKLRRQAWYMQNLGPRLVIKLNTSASKCKFGARVGKHKLGAPRPVNTGFGPRPVNTNWGPGIVNTNTGTGPVNINWGPKLGTRIRVEEREGNQKIQTPDNYFVFLILFSLMFLTFVYAFYQLNIKSPY